MIPTKNLLKIVAAISGCAIPMASLRAATINQIANSNNSGNTWNTSALWGSAPSAGNDYVSVDGGGSTLIYTVNGTAWNQGAWSVQTVTTTGAGTSTAFGGDHLVLKPNTTLNDRAGGGSTQTASLVFDGGFYRGNNGNTGAQSSILAGTIDFATGTTVGAIGTGVTGQTTGNFTFTLNSTITGGAGNVLQLTLNGGTSKAVLFNVNGNLSGFAGTLYLGVSTAGIQVGTGSSSAFSISSNALSASVQLDTTGTNFRYNLGSGNVTFGSLLYGSGTGTLVAPGVYDATQLNALTSSSAFFGAGSITVVPEPGTTALGALGLLMGIVMLRRRRRVS